MLYDNKLNNNKTEAKKEVIKSGIILTSVIASSIYAPKIAGKITKRNPIELVETVKKTNSELIDNFVQQANPKNNIRKILSKAKEKKKQHICS